MVRWGRLHKAAAVRGETGHRFPAGDGRTGLALREPNSETEFGRGVWSPRPSGVHVGAGLRPRPLSPGEMEVAGESVGADLCVGPNTFCCGSRSRADTQVRPYAGWKVFRTTLASGAQRSVCGAVARDGWESERRLPPKEPSTLDNPSVSLRLTAPFTQGSLWAGGCGLPRRFASRNDSPDPLSFRGGPTGRRGNPFLFTMDGGSGRRVVGPYGWLREAPRDCRGSA